MAEALEALGEGDPRQVGRYRLVARLGEGGMGRVFLARSPGGRPVAVKVVRGELAGDPRFRERFAREVAAAGRVNSFFTAGVVDADPEGSPPWLATAYVAGVALGEAVAAYGPWQESAVRALGAGLVEALEKIHAVGVVHRDLKPSNVLLAPDGPRVIDFGISLAAEDTALTQTGSVVGTPGFMSPEQLTGAPVGPASDVFALGAVLAYAATGGGPFGTGSAHAVNFRAVYETPALGGVAPGLRELIGRCLAKEPRERPGVAELLELLAEPDQGVATADWLPAPVARAVRERTDTALPPGPPRTPASVPAPVPVPVPTEPDTPSAAPPSAVTVADGAAPADRTTADVTAFGTPPSASPSPAAGPRPGLSRRELLVGAGGIAVVAGGGVLVAALAGSDDAAGESGGDAEGAGAGDGGGRAAEARTVRIAFHGPLSGTLEGEGTDMLDAARLAVADARESGGGHPGLRFAIDGVDLQAVSGTVRELAEAELTDERVIAVVGPTLSYAADMSVYERAGLAAVSPGATALADGGGTFLRAVSNDRQLGAAIGRFLAGQGAGKVMLVDDDTEFGTALSDAALDALIGASVTVVRDAVREDVPDGDAHARKVVNSGADAVAYCGYWVASGPLAAGLAGQGWSGLRVGGPEIMGSGFLDEAGDAGEGWYAVSPAHDLTLSRARREFAQRYETSTGRPAGRTTLRAYDVTMMIIEAVVALGPEDADRAAVYRRLAGTRYEGLSGVIAFDGGGEYAGSGPELFRVTDGAFEPLGPVGDFDD